MSPLEIFGAALGVVGVGLMIRRSAWGWPVGLVQVALYAEIFWEAKLYSDVILQGVCFALQAYGWWFWVRGGERRDGPAVSRMTGRERVGWAGATAALTAAHGWAMASFTDAALPWWDAFILVASLVAQWWQARKKLECWAGWMVVNVVAVGVYWAKDLRLTAGLYAVFFALAVAGHRAWRAAMRVRRVAVFGPESTGKTTLAARLGAHFGAPVVAEYARECWDARGGITVKDMAHIAHTQAEREDLAASTAGRLLVCDTEALTTVLWSDLLYGECPKLVRMSAELRCRRYDLYLLTNTDVPFAADPQRCLPGAEERARAMALWREALVARELAFVEISGADAATREAQAVAAVEKLLD